jgi:hypothetical protein
MSAGGIECSEMLSAWAGLATIMSRMLLRCEALMISRTPVLLSEKGRAFGLLGLEIKGPG